MTQTAPAQENPQPEPTALTLVDGQAPPLSLKALHTALTDLGVEIPYSSLAQFIGMGDIAEQLGVGGKGNRREFPRWAVNFLADFLAWYTTAGIKKELAPNAVRHRLEQFRSSDEFRSSQNSITAREDPGSHQISTSQNSKTATDVTFYEPAQQADLTGPAARFFAGLLSPLTRLPAAMDNVADAIRELREGRSSAAALPPPQDRLLIKDRLLTAEEAAALLACSPRSVGRHVKEVLPRKWKESDVLRYIQQLKPKAQK